MALIEIDFDFTTPLAEKDFAMRLVKLLGAFQAGKPLERSAILVSSDSMFMTYGLIQGSLV